MRSNAGEQPGAPLPPQRGGGRAARGSRPSRGRGSHCVGALSRGHGRTQAPMLRTSLSPPGMAFPINPPSRPRQGPPALACSYVPGHGAGGTGCPLYPSPPSHIGQSELGAGGFTAQDTLGRSQELGAQACALPSARARSASPGQRKSSAESARETAARGTETPRWGHLLCSPGKHSPSPSSPRDFGVSSGSEPARRASWASTRSRTSLSNATTAR